jgi:hypothetical protein
LNKSINNYTGSSKGVDESLNNKKIRDWMKDGSWMEDLNIDILTSHFYNPLTNKGLTEMGITIGESAYDRTNNPSNLWSWKWARDVLYSGLTATDKTTRNINLSHTFEALGHAMHLVQDVAVPAHTRNDMHMPAVDGEPYEAYTASHALKLNYTLVPFPYWNVSISPNAPKQFWDLDTYDGTTAYDSGYIGLSEYTNANFYSKNTIGMEETFPHPNRLNTNLSDFSLLPTTVITTPGNVTHTIFSITGYGKQHLAALKYVAKEIWNLPIPLPIKKYKLSLFLDNRCHEEYAQYLVPRAVGYSAGLLDYFFRGKLGITQVSGGIKVKNLGTETMSSYVDQTSQTTIGMITVYYDDSSGNRTFLANYDLTTPLEPGAETDVISFAPPTGNITAKRYIVVFRGKLGKEEGAVIGKVTAPPHVYYVATMSGWDKIYNIDVDGTNHSVVYDNPDGDYIGRIALSPDGNTIAFASSPDGLVVNSTIQTLGLADTTLIPTVLTSGNWPSWSPDGTKIVFERDISLDPYSADIEIFTVDVATSAETQLTNLAGSSYSGSPAWSPDGNFIAYSKFVQSQTGCATNYVISLMDTAGNPLGPLTCPASGEYMSVGDFDPAWSPDGQEIVFTRREYVGRSSQLNKVAVATKAITKLTDSPDVGYDEYTPAWSPDEMTIAIGSMRDGDYDIWLVDPYGSGYQMNVTNSNSGIDGYPAFGQ